MTAARVVVTGAAGFVGGHLVRRLAAAGHEVLALVRAPAHPPVHGVHVVARDLAATSSVRELLRTGDVVVHLAARVHVMHDRAADPRAAYRAANVAPTRMLAESAAAAGAARLVFLSTAKVYGEGRPTPYTRDDVPRPSDPYAQSKLEAEEQVREIATASQLEWTIFRPPFVYGPGGRGNFPRLVQLARIATRVPLPLGAIRNARSVIFVGNLVDAIERAVGHPAARDRIFLPTDRHDVSTPALIRAIAEARGQRARLFDCPPSLLRAAATVLGRRAEMTRLTESLQLDGRALRHELQWEPPHSLDASIRYSLGLAPTGSPTQVDG